MKRDFVITFTSPDRPGVVDDLTGLVVACGGNWEESRLVKLCGDFAGVARVTLDEEQVASFSDQLHAFSAKGINANCRAASPAELATDGTSATLVCSGADHEGIVSGLAKQLASMGINVAEMETTVEAASTSGIPLFRMTCELEIPASCPLDGLKQDLRHLEQELAVEIELNA